MNCKNLNDTCFVNLQGSGKTIRGCWEEHATSDVIDSCNKDPAFCLKCTSNSCNNRSVASESCYRCETSNTDECNYESCAKVPKMVGCFTYKEKNVEMKGCMSRLTPKQRDDCHLGKNNCKVSIHHYVICPTIQTGQLFQIIIENKCILLNENIIKAKKKIS